MDFNPVAVDALIRLTLGGLPPGRDGGLLNARLRYFDPARKRAGLPEDVAALVSEMTATSTRVTLVNLNQASARTVVVQGGAYGEHRIESVQSNGRRRPHRPSQLHRQARARSGRHPHDRHETLLGHADRSVSRSRPLGIRAHFLRSSVASVNARTAIAARRAVSRTPHTPMSIASARGSRNLGARSP